MEADLAHWKEWGLHSRPGASFPGDSWTVNPQSGCCKKGRCGAVWQHLCGVDHSGHFSGPTLYTCTKHQSHQLMLHTVQTDLKITNFKCKLYYVMQDKWLLFKANNPRWYLLFKMKNFSSGFTSYSGTEIVFLLTVLCLWFDHTLNLMVLYVVQLQVWNGICCCWHGSRKTPAGLLVLLQWWAAICRPKAISRITCAQLSRAPSASILVADVIMTSQHL